MRWHRAQEAGRYLETFKAYEHKPAASIQERSDADYASRLASALTAVRAVNRTDALALGAQLGSLADILRASREQLSACPGIGPTKLNNLWEAFHKPLRKAAAGVGGAAAGGPAGAPGSQAAAAAAAAPGAAGVLLPAAQQRAPGQGGGGGQETAPEGPAAAVAGQQEEDEMAWAGEERHDQVDSGHGDQEAAAAEQEEEEEGDEGGQPVADSPDGEDGDPLVYMASQMMLRVQAGAMVTGALDSDDDEEGAGVEVL